MNMCVEKTRKCATSSLSKDVFLSPGCADLLLDLALEVLELLLELRVLLDELLLLVLELVDLQ